MKYGNIWKKVLNPDEKVMHEFSVGDRYLKFNLILWGVFALCFSFLSIYLGVALVLVVLFYFGFYLRVANAYAFTNKRILIHRGWLSTQTINVTYDKVTDITVVDPFLERIITGSGSLVVNTAGTADKEIVLQHIAAPYELKKKLDEIR